MEEEIFDKERDWDQGSMRIEDETHTVVDLSDARGGGEPVRRRIKL